MGVMMGGRMACGFFGGLLLVAGAVAVAAEAAPPTGYAVVSLIGDKLSVVTHAMRTR
jgi:hypothetical protein